MDFDNLCEMEGEVFLQKITFIINSLSSGGAEKVLSVIVAELIKQNYQVEIIFLEQNEFYKLDKRIKNIYLSNFNGSESGLKKLLYIPLLAYRLKKYIQKNDIKLIQSHIFRANYVNVLAKLFGATHKAQVVTAGRVSRYKELGLNGKINLWLIKTLYAKADLIISKAQGMQEDMQKLFNYNVPQIVINNPYDIKLIETLSQEKVEFEFKKEKRYLILVGRLIKLKRNHEMIEVLKKLNEDVELIFLGDGSEKENLQSLVKNYSLESRVHFLGQVSNPYKYISKSDIFVSCSESEGFPNVLVESMICKTVVVSSDCVSGPKEILGDNECGLLFDVGNKEKLLEHIGFLLENENDRKIFIEKARKRAEDFSIESIIKKYKEVLEVE